jgi:predicted secreted protein
MDWWLDSVFGNTTEADNAALSKLPAELVALMKDKGLDANISTTYEAKLPPELMEMAREYFNANAYTLPMGLEEAKEHRIKLMEARSAFVKTAEAGWQEHSYSFCEH